MGIPRFTLVDFQREIKDYGPGSFQSHMTIPQKSETARTEMSLQWLMILGCWGVVLWVRFGSTDSTLGKSDILFTVVTLVATLFLIRQLRAGEIVWQSSMAELLLTGIIGTATISFLVSPFRDTGGGALVLLYSYALCFLIGMQVFRNRRSLQRLLDHLALLSLVVSLVALVQYAGLLDIEFALGSSRRVVSTLGNATYLADFLSMMIPIEVGSVITAQHSRRKFLGGVLIGLMVVVLFLTQARTGIIVTGAVLLFMFAIMRWSGRWRAGAVLLGIAVATTLLVLSVPGIGERLSELSAPGQSISLARRMIFWEAGTASVPDAPILGHGPGSFPFVVAEYRTPDYWVTGSEDIVPHAHNELLEVTVETGTVGLFLTLFLLGYLATNARGLVTTGGSWSRITALAICGGLIAVFLDNMTGVSLRRAPVGMIAWTLAGVLLSEVFRKDALRRFAVPVLLSRAASGLLPALWIAGMLYLWQGTAARFSSDAALLAGRLEAGQGHHREAAGHFRDAVAADRFNHVAQFDLTVASLRSGDLTEALNGVATLRSLSAAYPKINLLESLAFLETDSLDLAAESIREEIRLRDHPEAYYTWSLILARMDDTDGVRSALEKVLERNIVGMSQVHLESSAQTLGAIAETREDLVRLHALLAQIRRYVPRNSVIAELVTETERRIAGSK